MKAKHSDVPPELDGPPNISRRQFLSMGAAVLAGEIIPRYIDRVIEDTIDFYKCSSFGKDVDYEEKYNQLPDTIENNSIRVGPSPKIKSGILDLWRPSKKEDSDWEQWQNVVAQARRGIFGESCGTELTRATITTHELPTTEDEKAMLFMYKPMPNGVQLNLAAAIPTDTSEQTVESGHVVIKALLGRNSTLPEQFSLHNNYGIKERITNVKVGGRVIRASDMGEINDGYEKAGHYETYAVPDDKTVWYGGDNGWVYYQAVETDDQSNLLRVQTEWRETPWLDKPELNRLAAPLNGGAWCEDVAIILNTPTQQTLRDATWKMGYFYDPTFFDTD